MLRVRGAFTTLESPSPSRFFTTGLHSRKTPSSGRPERLTIPEITSTAQGQAFIDHVFGTGESKLSWDRINQVLHRLAQTGGKQAALVILDQVLQREHPHIYYRLDLRPIMTHWLRSPDNVHNLVALYCRWQGLVYQTKSTCTGAVEAVDAITLKILAHVLVHTSEFTTLSDKILCSRATKLQRYSTSRTSESTHTLLQLDSASQTTGMELHHHGVEPKLPISPRIDRRFFTLFLRFLFRMPLLPPRVQSTVVLLVAYYHQRFGPLDPLTLTMAIYPLVHILDCLWATRVSALPGTGPGKCDPRRVLTNPQALNQLLCVLADPYQEPLADLWDADPTFVENVQFTLALILKSLAIRCTFTESGGSHFPPPEPPLGECVADSHALSFDTMYKFLDLQTSISDPIPGLMSSSQDHSRVITLDYYQTLASELRHELSSPSHRPFSNGKLGWRGLEAVLSVGQRGICSAEMLPELVRVFQTLTRAEPTMVSPAFYSKLMAACCQQRAKDQALVVYNLFRSRYNHQGLLGTCHLTQLLVSEGDVATLVRVCRENNSPFLLNHVIQQLATPLAAHMVNTGAPSSALSSSTTPSDPSLVASYRSLFSFLDQLFTQPASTTRSSSTPVGPSLIQSLVTARWNKPLYRQGYASVITTLLKLQQWETARLVHIFLLSRGAFPDIRVFNQLLKQLVNNSLVEQAYACYRAFIECHHRPNTYSGCIILHGIAMRGASKSFDNTSADVHLQRYSREHSPRNTNAQVPPALPSDPSLPSWMNPNNNYVPPLPPAADVISQVCTDLKQSNVNLDTALLTSVLQCLLYTGEPVESVRLIFNDMLHSSAQPNAVTYLVMMWGYARVGRFTEVVDLLEQLKRSIPLSAGQDDSRRPNLAHYGVLMYAYSRAGELAKVLQVWSEVSQQFPRPNVQVFNIVLLALLRSGKHRMALSFFEQLHGPGTAQPSFSYSSGTSPLSSPLPLASEPSTPSGTTDSAMMSPHTASLLIRAHLLNDDLGQAWHIFCQLQTHDPLVNSHILESFLRFFIKRKDLPACEKLFEAITQESVKPLYWIDYLALIRLAVKQRRYSLVAGYYHSLRVNYQYYFPRIDPRSTLQKRFPRLWRLLLDCQAVPEGEPCPKSRIMTLKTDTPTAFANEPTPEAGTRAQGKPSIREKFYLPHALAKDIVIACLHANRPDLALLAHHDILAWMTSRKFWPVEVEHLLQRREDALVSPNRTD
ncbi:hypothetical protein IWQ62_001446 [Dispira parvispora]|uniref:Uncharacterized protein n=1 Tax=Dispira parvispora TaxID=1520584 RepID=A0A9W8AW26_9FUNG|nr:hypothetical protein IWQ62_001446 [Dispira parvispora]